MWQMPTIDGKPVEHHILVGVRDLLRQKGYTKSGLVPNLNGTGRVPYCYMDRLSVQVRTRLFRGIGLEPHARGMVHRFKPDFTVRIRVGDESHFMSHVCQFRHLRATTR